MHNTSILGGTQLSCEFEWSSKRKEFPSFSMAFMRALVIGPLGACGGDGVSVRVVEECSASCHVVDVHITPLEER